MAYEKAKVVLPAWHNAKDWYNDAINSGYTVGTTSSLLEAINSFGIWIIIPLLFIIVCLFQIIKCLSKQNQ